MLKVSADMSAETAPLNPGNSKSWQLWQASRNDQPCVPLTMTCLDLSRQWGKNKGGRQNHNDEHHLPERSAGIQPQKQVEL